MEPEGVVNVLRRLVRTLVPGGRVVDLASVPPDGTVEASGVVLGTLDESAFFPRAAACAAALDELVAEGLLALESEERFPVRIRYPSGPEAVEDVAERTYGRMPDEVAAVVGAITGPVEIRETGSVRSFRRL
jgi:hypothetical protein